MKVVANLGYNWWDKSGGEERTKALVGDAIDSGVDAVVVPCFKAEEVYRSDELVKANLKFQMPMELVYDLKESAESQGIEFYVAPRYPGCIEYLKNVGVSRFHVQNGDINHVPLLKELSGEVVLLSTGFASLPEVDDAANILLGDTEPADSNLVLLHSTGKMPTPPSEAQFGRMLDMGSEFFPLPYGFESFFDHGSGKILDYMAMAFNPEVIMRRFDLTDRKGLETAYSLDPSEMKLLVEVARSMVSVNNPQFYHDGFVEGDFDARAQQLRCEKDDYLLPSEK